MWKYHNLSGDFSVGIAKYVGWLTSIIPKDSNFEALSDKTTPGRQLASLRVRGGFRFESDLLDLDGFG